MLGVRRIFLLFCLILVNLIDETDGVGTEADNANDQRDLLFGQMWRKAFEVNRHNGKEGEEKEMPKEVKEEQKEEEGKEEEKQKEVKKEKPKGEKEEKEKQKGVKGEQKEDEESKLWQKVKREPINDQLKEEEEEREKRKKQKTIKKEPKNEQNEMENLVGKSEAEKTDQNKLQKSAKALGVRRKNIYKWKKELKQRKKTGAKSEERNFEIIEQFDKIRKEYKMEKDYKWKERNTIDQEIANALGTSRKKIYKWKRELNQRKEAESEESEGEKWEIINEFDKMRKEYKMKKDYKNGDRNKMEQAIAKALGISRRTIYKWKKELLFAKSNPLEKRTNEQKGQIIELFDKLCEEFANKFNRKASEQIKGKIARKFGVSGRTIYKWKQILKTN